MIASNRAAIMTPPRSFSSYVERVLIILYSSGKPQTMRKIPLLTVEKFVVTI
jgi:hypothetical protein